MNYRVKNKTGRCYRVLVDGREFQKGKTTGIARFLSGLLDAIGESGLGIQIVLACNEIPRVLNDQAVIEKIIIPRSFFLSELKVTLLASKGIDLFISPYPKIPLFGIGCPFINTVHDVLDLTYQDYRSGLKTRFDRARLESGIKKANITWFVSEWSLKEAKKLIKSSIDKARVRYNGIDDIFTHHAHPNEKEILNNYRLEPGYILVLGNGKPHKNLGVLLEITHKTKRRLICAGVNRQNRNYWQERHTESNAIWIENIPQADLPVILRNAFCLAQPSLIEGYGYPPLEAMACGAPAVISNIPVLVETTGGNALSADPDSPEKWLESFAVLENKSVYQSQKEKGLKWVEPLKGSQGWKNHIADITAILQGPKN